MSPLPRVSAAESTFPVSPVACIGNTDLPFADAEPVVEPDRSATCPHGNG